MPVYRPVPQPFVGVKIAPLLDTGGGASISADARLSTYSPILGTTAVAKTSDSRWDFRSTELGQSQVSRPAESRWFFESPVSGSGLGIKIATSTWNFSSTVTGLTQVNKPAESRWDMRSLENGSSSVDRPSNSRLTFSTAQTGNSAVSKVAQAALAVRSTLAGLGSLTAQVLADARLFFRSLFKGSGDVTTGFISGRTFEASNLVLDIDFGRRVFEIEWAKQLNLDWYGARSFRIVDLEMTKTGVRIDPVVIGDDFTIRRVYTGLPAGISIDKAWFTVRVSDLDPSALIEKIITPSETAAGHIVVADTASGYLEMFFNPARTETELASTSVDYVYDVQVKTTTSKIYTLEKGNISFITGTTTAIS